MDNNEFYIVNFEKPATKYIVNHIEELFAFIYSHDVVIIRELELDYQDFLIKKNNPDYLCDKYFELFDDFVSLMTINPRIMKILKSKIYPHVRKLSVPGTFLEDITILNSFPNLEFIEINSYSYLSREQIDYIKNNTSVKEIVGAKKNVVPNNFPLSGDDIFIPFDDAILKTGSLIIHREIVSSSFNDVTVRVCGDKYDLSKIDELLHRFNFDSVINLTVENSLIVRDNVYEKLFSISFNKEKNSLKLIFYGYKGVTDLPILFESISKYFLVEQVTLKCDNKTYDKLYYLNSMAKKTELVIDYKCGNKCNLESFIAMRATIDWFNSLIRESLLSPLEVVLLGYDIIRTFKYNKNPNDSSLSAYLHHIVMYDYIVCVGYSSFINQILLENGIKITNISVSCKVNNDGKETLLGHSRNLVRIDDDKYGVHGIFTLDATWDNINKHIYLVEYEDGTREVVNVVPDGCKIIKKFDSTGLYSNFLIPLLDYEKVYPNNTKPRIYDILSKGEYDKIVKSDDNKVEYDYLALDEIHKLFGFGYSIEVIKNYAYVKKPSLEVFTEALYNVRVAEGYSNEAALQSVNDSVELNQAIDNYNRRNNSFFSSDESKQTR